MPIRILTRLLAGALATLALIAAGLAAFTWRTARKVEAALPPSGRFLDIDGGRLHVAESGPPHAPPILLIHGLGGQLLNFPSATIAPLRDAYRVIAIDRPGSGYSTRAFTAPANLRAQAATIAKAIRALGLRRPLVVGHSLGGAVALALALDHPECVGGLALIAPLTHPIASVPTPFRRLAVRSRLLRLLIAWTLAIPATLRRSPETLAIVFGPDPMPPDFATAAGGMLTLRPAAYIAASADLVAASADLPGMVQRYPGLTLPIGVLYGSSDRLLDPTLHGHGLAALIPGLELELIENGGHMTPVTAPERTAGFIRRMAERVAR